MIPIEIHKKIKDLREELNQANHEYYIKENSSLTDFEYDKKFKELLTLENEYPASRYTNLMPMYCAAIA